MAANKFLKQRKHKVLLIGGPEASQNHIQAILDLVYPNSLFEGFPNLNGAFESLSTMTFDCILIDCALGDVETFRVIEAIKASPRAVKTAIIVLSNNLDIEKEIELLQAGAHEYIIKEILNPKTLTRALQKSVEIARLRHQLEVSRESSIHNAKWAALGVMAGGVAHEINNPLQIISGCVENLIAFHERDRLDADQIVRISKMMNSAIDRVSEITGSLRVVSTESSKDVDENVVLKPIVEDVIRNLKKGFEEEVELKIDVSVSEDLRIKADASEMFQVFEQVIKNSIQATEKTKNPWIEISAEIEGNFIEIKISDNGVGVSGKDSEFVFQPFFTTRSVGAGKGLGLSICKKIIEAHQGTVRFTPDERHTTLLIRLLNPEVEEKAAA